MYVTFPFSRWLFYCPWQYLLWYKRKQSISGSLWWQRYRLHSWQYHVVSLLIFNSLQWSQGCCLPSPLTGKCWELEGFLGMDGFCPFFPGTIFRQHLLCEVGTECLYWSCDSCHFRIRLWDDEGIWHCHIKKEPENVLVVLSTFQSDVVVLAKLIVVVHTFYVFVVMGNSFRTRILFVFTCSQFMLNWVQWNTLTVSGCYSYWSCILPYRYSQVWQLDTLHCDTISSIWKSIF